MIHKAISVRKALFIVPFFLIQAALVETKVLNNLAAGVGPHLTAFAVVAPLSLIITFLCLYLRVDIFPFEKVEQTFRLESNHDVLLIW